MKGETESRIAAEEYLDVLAAHEIDHLFVNPGTDFAPIIEAFARAGRSNRKVPRPMVVPHEHAAVAMAHGYTLITGRPQAVMLHVNVGLANSINALIDASRDRVPLLLTSGRTPITEAGPHGARSVYIHWAQEMFDQAGMVREFVKWDYELRRGDQVGNVVDRALEVAQSPPMGPVYLALPREVLGERMPTREDARRMPRARPERPRPAGGDIERAAEWIVTARNPLVITGQLGRDPREAVLLTKLAEQFALPVVPFNARHFAISGNHPMFQGSTPGSLLDEADLVVALESDVPWIPSLGSPAPDARIIQVGEDPLYLRYPMRSFRSDLTIAANLVPFLQSLEQALGRHRITHAVAIDARRKRLGARSAELHAAWAAEVQKAGHADSINLAWLNHCLHDIISTDTLVVNEYSFRQEYCPLDVPGSLFSVGPAGGLGWGLPAALGIKLASPQKQVVALLGDGAYMFANPTACHMVAETQGLPILSVIYNNALYGAVRRATLDMYADGVASEADGRLLADLPSPAYERTIEAHGGLGIRVDRPADLPGALRRASEAVRGGQQALVNVLCRG
jgi:acetolactate synthase I/II/III large subunit